MSKKLIFFNYSAIKSRERTVSEGVPVPMQTKSMLQLMYNITLRDQPVVPRRVTGISAGDEMLNVYYTALFLLKHPFYVQIPIFYSVVNILKAIQR